MCCSPCGPNAGDSQIGWGSLMGGDYYATGLTIVSKLLQDQALEEGEEYEYIPIQTLDLGDPGDPSTPRKKGRPAAPDALPHELKQMPM